MADLAAGNCETIDCALLLALRSDATQIRICTPKALFQCLGNRASERVRTSALRTASMYTGVAARMTQLIQDGAFPALAQSVGLLNSLLRCDQRFVLQNRPTLFNHIQMIHVQILQCVHRA